MCLWNYVGTPLNNIVKNLACSWSQLLIDVTVLLLIYTQNYLGSTSASHTCKLLIFNFQDLSQDWIVGDYLVYDIVSKDTQWFASEQ